MTGYELLMRHEPETIGQPSKDETKQENIYKIAEEVWKEGGPTERRRSVYASCCNDAGQFFKMNGMTHAMCLSLISCL